MFLFGIRRSFGLFNSSRLYSPALTPSFLRCDNRIYTTSIESHPAQLQFVGEPPIPYLTLQLPSTATPVSFRISKVKPISHILTAIQEEDKSIKELALYDVDYHSPGETNPTGNVLDEGVTGVRWARSTIAEDILAVALKHGGLILDVDGKKIPINIPTLNERLLPLNASLDKIRSDIEPLEVQKKALDKLALNAAFRLSWLGLISLCAQLGLMVRLTYVEYSWDGEEF
ncbi:hypothetical protein HK098_006967 [Nowakowskiella sp. JEL0407]|nr:hypothetical protein HK098_006967 [Nowakowskiella sp. JEL0407]